jgi:hypothetical protein
MSNWFDVDKAGLAKLLAGRSKAFVVFELLQNAWDQNVTEVDVTIAPAPGTRHAQITVVDDDPEGFADLRDAYTLFAESEKKGNVAQRGRFNLGEKLVLALAKSARIETTTGTVDFTEGGERIARRARREKGSLFQATIPMMKGEIEETLAATKTLIVPVGITTRINGRTLADRSPVVSFEETLPTIIADAEGVLRRTNRKTTVRVHATLPGETATLYEMGIPVVESGDRFHVDVGQKVPLNMDRDNVPPAYLRAIRVAVLNATHHLIDEDDSRQTWVREACGDERVQPEAVKAALTLRFGANAVRYDPSDPEANKRSAAEGRPVVYGGSLTSAEWSNASRAGALPAAGLVSPSPKPYSPDGDPLDVVPEAEWTTGMRTVVNYAVAVGRELLGCHIQVAIAREPKWPYGATYGRGRLVFNLARCGRSFFEQGITDDVNRLLLHEFAHHYEGDHLSQRYYDALADLGARLARLALDKPELFRL